MENLNRSLGHLIHIISLDMKKRLEKEIRVLGLTSAHQFGVLLLLSDKELSQKEISEQTTADEPTTTRMINRMIAKNFVAKRQSSEDKRKQVVYLTPEGRDVLDKALPISQKINNQMQLSLEDSEQEELIRLLNKIYLKV